MSDIKLLATNEPDLSSGDYAFVEGGEAVAQHLKLRLQSDRLLGILRGNFDKTVPEGVIRIRIRDIITNTPGVTSIVSFDTSVTNRVLTVNAQIKVDGDAELEFSFTG